MTNYHAPIPTPSSGRPASRPDSAPQARSDRADRLPGRRGRALEPPPTRQDTTASLQSVRLISSPAQVHQATSIQSVG